MLIYQYILLASNKPINGQENAVVTKCSNLQEVRQTIMSSSVAQKNENSKRKYTTVVASDIALKSANGLVKMAA